VTTSHTDARPFDVRGPLPTGVTVLEASAGTGKTYTIAALAARYVADGVPLEKLLLVTFTRMATGELRERVRERLVSVEHELSRVLAGVTPSTDEVVALLAEGTNERVRQRRDRLAQALADFDAATIATTHGFCQEVLASLGIAGDIDPDTTFVEDVRDLVEEIVDDLYVRRFHTDDKPPPFTRAQAAEIARVAVENPAAPIVSAKGDTPQMRRRLAEAVRKEFDERKRRMAVMGYDDLLTRFQQTLAAPGGDAVAERLRARWSVVLVDEFQDTDPVQWDIVQRAFGDGTTTLVLIGDPKQAIYAFRGADVYAYLDAARSAGARATLDINWRSDQGLIDAYDTTFGGAKLGNEGIVYRKVKAAGANQTPRLTGAPRPAPLRIRQVRRDDPGIALTAKGFANLNSAREHVAADVAQDLVELLSSNAHIECRTDDGQTREHQDVSPGHVAVLVPTNRLAARIRDALDTAGIPAVINGAGSVFGTPAAREWLRLLEAIERPASPTRARAAALTCFFGWTTEQVAAAGEDGGEEIHRRLHDWARTLRVKGVASLTEMITLVERLPRRVLARADGERQLTDLRHVAQLLHAAAAAEQMGTTALTAWLRRRIAEADQDTGDEERSRRLESDAEAVAVLTIHRSKGLEFPIVYLPFLWEPGRIPNGKQPVLFHDAGAGDKRTIDLALQGEDFRRHHEQAVVEQRGEDLRLAYVSLTRAQHQAVVWWAGSWDSRNSPLGRLLFRRDPDGNVAPQGARVPTDTAAGERFAQLAVEAPGAIAVERSTLGLPTTWTRPLDDATQLEAATFDRSLDRQWRRTSYSDITAGAYEPWVASEPEDAAVVVDEPAAPTRPPAAVQRGAGAKGGGGADEGGDAGTEDRDGSSDDGGGPMATPSLLGEMPVGLRVGTLVHRVLEATDFAAADLDAELAAHIAKAQARRSVDIGDPATVVAGLRAALQTPLGPILDNTRLRDIPRNDRLDELDFELPLAGGDEPRGQFALSALGDVLREHLPDGDPLAGYADRLDDPALRRTMRGYLTGSLDLVLRTHDTDGTPRFAVVDYKTNWLAPPDAALTAWHHRPAALAAEMRRAHYGLQALLYTAALHRYLRWRLPGYDPERNLAGVLYLFLRGMTGPDTPTVDGAPCGVFAWRPTAPLVEALSDALDGAPVR